MGLLSVLGSVTSALAPIASPIVSLINNNKQIKGSQAMQEDAQDFTDEQRLAQQEYATSERLAAQDWNLEMWQRQNLYNSPAEVLARARAAGINPNSLLPNAGSAMATELTTSPQSATAGASAGQGSYPTLRNPVQDLMSILQTQKQNDLLEQQASKTKEEVYLTREQTKEVAQKIMESKSVQALNDVHRKEILDMLPHLVTKTQSEIKSIEKSIAATVAHISQMEAETKNLNEELRSKRFNNDILQLQSSLAKNYGLFLGAGELGALVSLALSGEKGSAALEEVFNTIASAYNLLKDSAVNEVSSVWEDLWNPTPTGPGADHGRSLGDVLLGRKLYKKRQPVHTVDHVGM